VLLVTCTRGLEDITERELKELGMKVRERFFGKVLVEGWVEEAVLLNFAARTINRVFLLLYNGTAETLDQIYRKAREIEWEEFITENMSFGVEAKRVGKHSFSSPDIASEVGRAVIERVQEKAGFRPRVFLRDPDLKVYAELNRKRLFIGIDTSGESLHMRRYRVYQHPAPIQPTLASALLLLAGKPEKLLDPFCGSGTIVIEAARMLRNIPQSRSFAFQRIPLFSGILEEMKRRWKTSGERYELRGFDLCEKHVRGAVKNAKNAGVGDTVSFWVGDACKKESYPEEIGTVVTNPPYGLRIASKKFIEKIYEKFTRTLADLGFERLVLITGEPYFLRAAEKAGLQLTEKRSVIYGSLPALVLVYS